MPPEIPPSAKQSESNNPRLTAYLNLVHQAELEAVWGSMDGVFQQGRGPALIRATLAAVKAGLTDHEIETAALIGEDRGLPKRGQDPEKSIRHSAEYWVAIHREAEQFWLARYQAAVGEKPHPKTELPHLTRDVFPIISIEREDLESILGSEELQHITNADVKAIAEIMESQYREKYWDDLRFATSKVFEEKSQK